MIKIGIRSGLLGATLLGGVLLTGAIAMAQSTVTDPASMPEYRGTVAHYELTPAGGVDGLILDDGTEVHFPPPLGVQVVSVARVGDAVTVHGTKTGTVVAAGSIAGPAGGKTVVNDAPQAPPAPPPPPVRDRTAAAPPPPPVGGPGRPGPVGKPMDANGAVAMLLHGPRGEVNGVLLQDGTQVRMPPGSATATVQTGQTIAVRGNGVDTVFGRVIAAREMGASLDKLAAVQPPPPPAGAPAVAPTSPAAAADPAAAALAQPAAR